MVHFSQKKLHIGGILFLLFNEISINISWLEHPVFAFGFRTFKIKNYPCITFNKDIFNYCNRKSDSIWVQIESLLAERVGFEPTIPFGGIHDFQSCSLGHLGHLSSMIFYMCSTRRALTTLVYYTI